LNRDLPKNDFADSFVIADCLRFGRINKEVYLSDYRYAALKTLTRARFYAVQNLIKEKQRLINIIFKKYAGLVWKQHQSGGFESENTHLIHSGNRILKYYLCEAAFSLVRCDAEYNSFYHLKYNEVNKFQHKRALALTARKFVRLVFRLLKDNRLYIPKL
jgi:hypothetical protein